MATESSEKLLLNPLAINPDSISLTGDSAGFTISRELSMATEGVDILTFKFSARKPTELKPMLIELAFPSIDINGFWNPSISVDKLNYYNSSISSKAARYAPVLSYYNNALENRICLSLSDALNKSHIQSYLKEEDVHFHIAIKLFDEKMPPLTNYSISLRIDTRPLPWHQSIAEVSEWWAAMDNYKPMYVPVDAKMPMYSTWYSYHQHINAEDIVSECTIAKSLGCEAVIVDDGWQTTDGNRGYAFTGDWQPERIGNMHQFVDAVHNTGMKFLLWYSLPFMGKNAKNYEKFKGKYLRYWESQGTYVLDPRYPEVREYIINTYIKALKNWQLDGFKLDFLGFFSANENTELSIDDGRDYASVNEATDALMTQVSKRLTELKPDILIEFRQPYIGPLMRKYGNMFRGVDAPNNAVANRLETTNLRVMAGNTAVHSDMFIWRKEEAPEKAALQILNILFSVPQLSVRLNEMPPEHLDMIKFWLTYWKENKETLMNADFFPSNPVSNFPVLTARNEKEQITAVYEDIVIDMPENIEKIDIINAKASEEIALRSEKNRSVTLLVKDCMGNLIDKDRIKLRKGINCIKIPPSGLAIVY